MRRAVSDGIFTVGGQCLTKSTLQDRIETQFSGDGTIQKSVTGIHASKVVNFSMNVKMPEIAMLSKKRCSIGSFSPKRAVYQVFEYHYLKAKRSGHYEDLSGRCV